jgi:hypothetical protein
MMINDHKNVVQETLFIQIPHLVDNHDFTQGDPHEQKPIFILLELRIGFCQLHYDQ